jgi:hypothetical protein
MFRSPEGLTRDELVLLCKLQQKSLERLKRKSIGHKRCLRELQSKTRIQKGEISILKSLLSDLDQPPEEMLA